MDRRRCVTCDLEPGRWFEFSSWTPGVMLPQQNWLKWNWTFFLLIATFSYFTQSQFLLRLRLSFPATRLLFFFFPASALYVYVIAVDTVMIGEIMHADGAVNGCVDTVLTGWRGHISPTVSGGSSGYALPSFRFDYSDACLMGVTSLPLHNLRRDDEQ